MTGFIQRLFWLFTCANRDELIAALLEQLDFSQNQTQVMRDFLPQYFRLTPAQRQRLLRSGKKLGPRVKDLLVIVTPWTFARWLANEKKATPPHPRPRKPGRPRKPFHLRELVLQFAKKENAWGYGRIMGELKKLTTGKICKSTVRNILQENGFDPSPRRGQGTWAEFLTSHAQTLWACDFFSQPVLTFRGWVDCYFILFIHINSRRIFITPGTAHPTGEWVAQQARNFLMHVQE